MTVAIDSDGPAYLRFIPEVSGTYTLTSSCNSGSCNPYCTMLADDMTTVLAANDNGAGSYNFRLTQDLISGKTYFFACTDSNADPSSYQVLLTYDAPLAPLEAAPGTNTVIDNENGLIYGIAPNVNVIGDYITAKSGYTFTCAPSGTAGAAAVYSTGSVVTVYSGNYSAMRYTVVLFGDVDGDGWYDGTDAYLVRLVANSMIPSSALTDAQRMAADCDHSGTVNAADAAILEQAGLLINEVDQTLLQEELQTNSAYLEYCGLIDQTIETSEPDDEQPIVVERLQPEAKTICGWMKALFSVVLSWLLGII